MASIRKCGEFREGDPIPNLAEHCLESIGDTLGSFNIHVRLVLALGVRLIGGVVKDSAWDTICEL